MLDDPFCIISIEEYMSSYQLGPPANPVVVEWSREVTGRLCHLTLSDLLNFCAPLVCTELGHDAVTLKL